MQRETNRPLRIRYSKAGDGWKWEIHYANGDLAATSQRTYAARWTARRSALLLIESCKTLAVTEETDENVRDYPLTKRKPDHVAEI